MGKLMAEYINYNNNVINDTQSVLLNKFYELTSTKNLTVNKQLENLNKVNTKINTTNLPIYNHKTIYPGDKISSSLINEEMVDILIDVTSAYTAIIDLEDRVNKHEQINLSFNNITEQKISDLKTYISTLKLMANKNGIESVFHWSFDKARNGDTLNNVETKYNENYTINNNKRKGVLTLKSNINNYLIGNVSAVYNQIDDYDENRRLNGYYDGLVEKDNINDLINPDNKNPWIVSTVVDSPITDKSIPDLMNVSMLDSYDGVTANITADLVDKNAGINYIKMEIVSKYDMEFPEIVAFNNQLSYSDLNEVQYKDLYSYIDYDVKGNDTIEIYNIPETRSSSLSFTILQTDYEKSDFLINRVQLFDSKTLDSVVKADTLNSSKVNNTLLFGNEIPTEQIANYNKIITNINNKIKQQPTLNDNLLSTIVNSELNGTGLDIDVTNDIIKKYDVDESGDKVRPLYKSFYFYKYGLQKLIIGNIKFSNYGSYKSAKIDSTTGCILELSLDSKYIIPYSKKGQYKSWKTSLKEGTPLSDVRYNLYIPELGELLPILPSETNEVIEKVNIKSDGTIISRFNRLNNNLNNLNRSSDYYGDINKIYRNNKIIYTYNSNLDYKIAVMEANKDNENNIYVIEYVPETYNNYNPYTVDVESLILNKLGGVPRTTELFENGNDGNNRIKLSRFPYTRDVSKVIKDNIIVKEDDENISYDSFFNNVSNVNNSQFISTQVDYQINKDGGTTLTNIDASKGGFISIIIKDKDNSNGIVARNLTDTETNIPPIFSNYNDEYSFYLDGQYIYFNTKIDNTKVIEISYNYLYSYIQTIIELSNNYPSIKSYTPKVFDYTLKFKVLKNDTRSN